jgi:hypothetical protein
MLLQDNSSITEIKWNLVGIFGKLFVDLLFATTRIESVGFENVQQLVSSRKFIFAIWHSRILLVSYLYKGTDASILVSQSGDGEIIARILQKQGHETIRGSTKKGGLRALAGLIKRLREREKFGVMIPDGPQGPRFKVQPGIIILAKKTGNPILPISYSAGKIKVFGSWDRFILPRPFTTCRVVYGVPIYIPADADKSEETRCLLRLEDELCRITFDADRYFNHRIS